ncbi:hypothetical protein PR048_004554 [Dryococelus australis]|uniref:Uncharacterized protein n=1 Tax=Dryococelus australis TaxID=614101 RepID=A0ABQ9I5S0_9NEOP|nr:hypothetical protein PR048_004554 [Dryococelus australis]
MLCSLTVKWERGASSSQLQLASARATVGQCARPMWTCGISHKVCPENLYPSPLPYRQQRFESSKLCHQMPTHLSSAKNTICHDDLIRRQPLSIKTRYLPVFVQGICSVQSMLAPNLNPSVMLKLSITTSQLSERLDLTIQFCYLPNICIGLTKIKWKTSPDTFSKSESEFIVCAFSRSDVLVTLPQRWVLQTRTLDSLKAFNLVKIV